MNTILVILFVLLLFCVVFTGFAMLFYEPQQNEDESCELHIPLDKIYDLNMQQILSESEIPTKENVFDWLK